MSRDNFDIPEVFRRAMEEAGWGEENGGKRGGGDGGNQGGGDRQPLPRQPNNPFRPNRTVILIAIVFIFFLSLNWIVTTYTDWLWFTELTYEDTWLRRWGIQVISFVVAFLVAGLLFLGNWHLARRRASRSTPEFYPKFLDVGGVGWLISGTGLFFTFIFASAAASQWEQILLYLYRVPFGEVDPIFSRDISFYLFELPVLEFVRSWLISIVLVTLLGTFAIYALNYIPAIQRGQWQPQRSPVLVRHVAVLATVFFLLWAAGYWLDLFRLNFAPGGVVYGATYTDMFATRYAIVAQLILMGLVAITAALNIFRFDLRPLFVTGALWLAVTLILGGIYPSLLQRYRVEPNEIVLEEPYISDNIRMTRLGFGLDRVEMRTFELGDDITADDILASEEVLNNIRLWDYRPLRETYSQLQALRTYYQFGDVDIDRYVIDGQLRQVMLAARELDKSQLPNPTWVNLNLEFTHGFGVVMNPVNIVTPEGQPEFWIQDLPPRSTVPIEVEQPEIYYGELMDDVVFVGSARNEFSFPPDNYSTYSGDGGVPLDTYLKRVAFALRLGDANVLLSDEITPETKIQFYRQIRTRINHITPFLRLDNDPYIVISEGRLFWIADAYTISNNFPYSQPLGSGANRINYIRNSVKVVVDAYHGSVDYYIFEPDDPIIRAYDSAFPDLFKSMEEFPEGLMAHIRYPEDIFRIQMRQFLSYHMTDERVFYNQEDLWDIPTEIFDASESPMEPYYVVLPLPGEAESEFLLIQPFVPSAKRNMVAWAAARNDMPHYGEIVVYELPRQELVFGPSQIESRINQQTEISQQFALWDQGGSRVIRGNMIVVPIAGDFLYVEPIYLQSAGNPLPELQRVVVATRTRIAMAETLERALAAVFQTAVAGVDVPEDVVIAEIEGPTEEELADSEVDVDLEPVAPGDETVTEEAPTLPSATPLPLIVDGSVDELIQAANSHFEAAQEAQRNGDWATYGAELQALEAVLQQLGTLTAGEATGP